MTLSGRQLLLLFFAFLLTALLSVFLIRKFRSVEPVVPAEMALSEDRTQADPDVEPDTGPSPYFVRYAETCEPVRDMPRSFRPGQTMPTGGEGKNSTSIDKVSFRPVNDLIEIYDDRVWWESDEDDATGDDEDDHLFHWAMEKPMCRLINMVDERGGILKVQDSYRDSGIHAAKSLHKQGRAVDVTWMDPETRENRSLSDLAKMCWAAGFNWVYFERSPPHIHASVRPERHDGD